jgi:predicted enzyme related to lactoylglutathione lyase
VGGYASTDVNIPARPLTAKREGFMAKVTGIGGIFFKARDVDAVRNWYHQHLGIRFDEGGGWSFHWREKDQPSHVGRTVWGPFAEDSSYFDPSDSPFMFNFRVDDLEDMLGRLRRAGVQVEDRVEEYEYGKFGWAFDLEGNKIELWEPRNEEGEPD